MNIQDAYTRWSESYDADRNLTRDLDQAVTKDFLEGMRCTLVLEIGCGTGKNTLLLAQIAERVCALDFSPGMIRKAQSRLHAKQVTFALANLTQSWPTVAQSADLVICNLVLEHIQDLSFIFSEARRVLKSGGRFLVSELHPFRQYRGVQANFQHDKETIQVPAFIHHISDFTGAAAQNGFALVRFKESWHAYDQDKPPRLATFLFEISA